MNALRNAVPTFSTLKNLRFVFVRGVAILAMSLPSFSKTRIAPTPSGFLHAGNALNFLLTAALAKRTGAGLLLRIDDMDQERYRKAYGMDVFETLHFLDIQWNEGPQNITDFEQVWSQRHRMELYTAALEKLRNSRAVFACTCTRTKSTGCDCDQKKFALDTPNASWRLRTSEKLVTVKTIDGKRSTAGVPDEMKNFIVRRKDGLPAYQLVSVVDDLHFGIDLVVRGEDMWPSTLAQQCLADALEEHRFSSICFYHHPLLKNKNGEKLSKSAGDTAVKHWREGGRSVKEFLTYMKECLQVPAESEGDLLPAFFA